MDNGNKIKISKPEVQLFLQGDLLPLEKDQPVSYDLEAEYAKTRRKKSPFVIIVMICCIVTVGLLTFGVSKYIEYKNNKLEVGIEVFEDLNLKNLLDVVSRTENSLKQATNQKIQFETELAAALKQAEIKRDSDLYLLETLKMSKSERLRRTEAIRKEYDSTVIALHAEYDPQITLSLNQIEEYKQQLASYDRKNIELAQEQEAAINSQRQLFELEKQQIVKDYEQIITDLRRQLDSAQQEQLSNQKTSIEAVSKQHQSELSLVDPIIKDEKSDGIIQAVLGSDTETQPPALFSKAEYILELSDDSLLQYADDVFTDVDELYSQFNYLADIVSRVPWANSLPEYIKAMTVLANTIGNRTIASAVKMLTSQDAVIMQQNQAIADARMQIQKERSALQSAAADIQYLQNENAVYQKALNAFDALARQNGDAGYILDASDSSKMLVYVSSLFADSVKDGTRAYVFRSSDKLVGTVTLTRSGKFIYAVPNDEASANIRANDRILLELIK